MGLTRTLSDTQFPLRPQRPLCPSVLFSSNRCCREAARRQTNFTGRHRGFAEIAEDAVLEGLTSTNSLTVYRIALMLLGVMFFVTAPAFAVPPSDAEAARDFARAQNSYQKLQRSDPRVGNLAAWERVASEFIRFIRAYDDPKYTPEALFSVADLYETTYRRRRSQSGLAKAAYFYEQVGRDYKDNARADEALFRLGDLRLNAMHDEAGANAAYQQIVKQYKGGKFYKDAVKRLKLPEESEADTAKESKAVPPAAGEKPGNSQDEKRKEASEAVEVGDAGKDIISRKNEIRRPIVVIDPGHGGKEEGARGVDGVLEKEVVLNVSLMLEELLRDRLRAKTVLTRKKDMDLPLPDRTKIANDEGADLFISIHANASELKNVTGIETYYLDNTNDKASLKMAERENASMLHQGGDLSFMLSDLIQNGKAPDSMALAHYIQNSLTQTLSRYYKDIKGLGVKKAPFYVLVGAHMPCVLVEISFIDHPLEGRRLITRRYQKLVAEAIYEGMRAFFESRKS